MLEELEPPALELALEPPAVPPAAAVGLDVGAAVTAAVVEELPGRVVAFAPERRWRVDGLTALVVGTVSGGAPAESLLPGALLPQAATETETTTATNASRTWRPLRSQRRRV